MATFKENLRQAVIVYLYRLRQSRQLRKFGTIYYVSKRMKYVVIYMDRSQVKDNIKKINALRYVRKVEPSYRPFLRVDYADLNENERFKMTEEDQEKFKENIKSEDK